MRLKRAIQRAFGSQNSNDVPAECWPPQLVLTNLTNQPAKFIDYELVQKPPQMQKAFV